jgi:hypothetical protein
MLQRTPNSGLLVHCKMEIHCLIGSSGGGWINECAQEEGNCPYNLSSLGSALENGHAFPKDKRMGYAGHS